MGPQHGRVEEALRLYTEVFADSKVDGILNYEAEAGDTAGAVTHAQFALSREKFMALGGGVGHAFFTEAISLEIRCATQATVDYYCNKLIV